MLPCLSLQSGVVGDPGFLVLDQSYLLGVQDSNVSNRVAGSLMTWSVSNRVAGGLMTWDVRFLTYEVCTTQQINGRPEIAFSGVGGVTGFPFYTCLPFSFMPYKLRCTVLSDLVRSCIAL